MSVLDELQDPRLYSNIKGMLTGKSREERIAAHGDLDQSKFRNVYGDEMPIEWDNPDIIELDKHFTKVNKLYGSMDTTELPYTLMQSLYNKSGRDVKRSKMALERINKQIEKDPDFKKYGAGDYLTRWYELTENPFENELPMDNQMMPEDFK
tara:strand:+ start:479 stop:934 length:456 start_codon:yes stop_codon:yes gene_type:complete